MLNRSQAILVIMTFSLRLLRCLIAGSLLWVSFVLPNESAGQTPDKQSIYSHLAARQFTEAETEARSYLISHPTDCPVHTMLGLALRGEGRIDAAYKSFRAAAKICPKSIPALESAAEIAYMRHLPEAEDLLNQLLLLRPQDATTHAMLGDLQARSGNCSGAVQNYGQGISAVEHSRSALRKYGGCLLVLERFSEAIEILKQALSAGEDVPIRIALARAQMQAKLDSAAMDTLKPLLNADSKEDTALLLAAQIAEAKNDTPQAIAWLRQAMQAAPKRVENYLYFAEMSFNHGSYQIGLDFINIGLREVPGDARLYVARGVLEVQVAKLDEALADFEEAHQRDPKLSFAEDAMGVLFSQKHDMTATLKLFERKSKEDPNDPLLQYLYAEALSEGESGDSQRIETAIGAARRALLLEPSYQPARDLLCVLLMRHGELQAVVDEANEALKHDPYDEVAIYQALLAQRRLKNPAQTEDLVRRLQLAKSHNNVAVTKYVLQEESTVP